MLSESVTAERDYVVAALDDLGHSSPPHGGREFSFYHPTLAEFLISPKGRNDGARDDIFVDVPRWHSRIAALLDARLKDEPQPRMITGSSMGSGIISQANALNRPMGVPHIELYHAAR